MAQKQDTKTQAEPVISVLPTAKEAGKYTDIALTGLFNAHVALVNSERQVIWQRYNVMILANTVVVSYVAQSDTQSLETLFASGFGLLLCGLWWFMTVAGWNVFNMYSDKAKRFYWLDGINRTEVIMNPFIVHDEDAKKWPFTHRKTQRKFKGGPIYIYAILVIMLFILWYFYSLIRDFIIIFYS